MSIKKILNTKWLIMILLLGIFPPAYFNQIKLLDYCLEGLKAIVWFFVLMLYFASIKFHMKKVFNILLYVLVIELLFTTLKSKDASIYLWITQIVNVIIICFFVEEMMTYAPYNGLKCIYAYFSLITLINTITIFIFPNAMYPNVGGVWVCWFLGEDNNAYFYYILVSTLAMLYCHYVSKRITFLALMDWLSAFIFVFHNDIATGIVCQLIWLILVVAYQFKWLRKLLKAQYALYIMLVGFVALVISRNLILAPVVEALGRDITLSGRTIVWDRTIELILKKPIFGYGVCNGDVYAEMIGRSGTTMAHDWILNLGFAGGVVAVAIHILQVFFACREAWTYRSTPYYHCLVIGFIIIYIRAVTEGSFWPAYFMFPAMLCYSKEFLNGITLNPAPKKRLLGRELVFRKGA